MHYSSSSIPVPTLMERGQMAIAFTGNQLILPGADTGKNNVFTWESLMACLSDVGFFTFSKLLTVGLSFMYFPPLLVGQDWGEEVLIWELLLMLTPFGHMLIFEFLNDYSIPVSTSIAFLLMLDFPNCFTVITVLERETTTLSEFTSR